MVSAPSMEKRAGCFSFTGCSYDPASGQALLSYAVDGQVLQENITFPWAPWPVDASRQAAFSRALELLHLMAGVSYFKAGLATRIELGQDKVTPQLAEFLQELYEQGLAEFAYVNQLDLDGVIDFRANADDPPGDMEVDLPERALVAMGGGKDSLVCLQLLRDAGIEVQPVCVGGSELIGHTVKAARLPLIRIGRQLSGVLNEMNADGAWNGHVPVTAINSAILVCAALLYGYRYVVFANESSANEATLIDERGREVNHQYSKSLAFEKALRAALERSVSSGVEYFSLLRPYGETAIAKRFANMDEFHPVFSSCNRNFHQHGTRIAGRWCQDCPKCRFTALALAPFMTPAQLLAIQGADLLNAPGQLPGFKSLCGIGEHKPFECVGRISECRTLFKHLSQLDAWKGKRIVATLAGFDEIQQAKSLATALDERAEHCIPATVLDRLDAF
ncbi:MAG: endonuclease domain-containing protein [Lysobacterales bacterium]|jgi:hypothetical protein